MAITPDGTRTYVTNYYSPAPDPSTVSLIDTDPTDPPGTYHTVVATITVERQASAAAITPNGAFAYVTSNTCPATVSVIDTDPLSPTYHTVVATVSAGCSAISVAITPDGNLAYVPNPAADTVSVIDTASNTVVATISTAPAGFFGPFGVAITPDGAFAYVTCQVSGIVLVIDTATNTVVKTVTVGTFPGGWPSRLFENFG